MKKEPRDFSAHHLLAVCAVLIGIAAHPAKAQVLWQIAVLGIILGNNSCSVAGLRSNH